jgi:two-component system chemotaxis response regulator CheY
MKFLIAEDDHTSRLLLKSFLARYGECDVAVDGREAVQAVSGARKARRGYDLVCMDLHMPVMDGQAAIREIRRQEEEAGVLRPVKIIVTTALGDMDNITTALVGKCSGYMVKPIDLGALLNELREIGLEI